MAIREDLVASAVTFLQDPSVASSPVESRVAFLQSKNLTQEEIDVALARASGEAAPAANYSNYGPQQQIMRQPQSPYGGYPNYQWQQQPPELPRRDWRDWFIMATMMGGVGYGLYFMAKRYVAPLIAPPTPPQLEQDKASIDASFEKAFALLDQLATDTEALKSSEKARTDRLDTALSEVESVIGELKFASRRREEDSRRINEEIRGIKDLIPKALDTQKELTDSRLMELSTELKSLKKLMSQRIPTTTAAAPQSQNTYRNPGTTQASPAGTNGAPSTSIPFDSAAPPRPASVNTISTTANSSNTNGNTNTNGNVNGSTPAVSLQTRSSSPFSAGMPLGRTAIPAWQMAAANKSTTPTSPSPTPTPAPAPAPAAPDAAPVSSS